MFTIELTYTIKFKIIKIVCVESRCNIVHQLKKVRVSSSDGEILTNKLLHLLFVQVRQKKKFDFIQYECYLKYVKISPVLLKN